MRGTGIVFRAELTRLLSSRASWWMLALVALASAARAYASTALLRARGDLLERGAGWKPFIDGWALGLALGAGIALVGGALSLASDLESGVARLTLTRSAGRGALLLGRALLAPVVTLPLVLVAALGSYLVAMRGLDFGPLVQEGFEFFSAEEVRREIGIGLLTVLPALAALWILGLTVATFSRGAAWAVALALGGWLAFDQFKPDLLRESAPYFFPAHVPSTEDTSAFEGLRAFVTGASDARPADEQLGAALIAPAVEVPLLLLGAWLILRRKRL